MLWNLETKSGANSLKPKKQIIKVTLPPGGVVGGGVTVPGSEVPGGEVPGGLRVPGNSRAAMITATTRKTTAPMIHHLCSAVGEVYHYLWSNDTEVHVHTCMYQFDGRFIAY